MGDIVYLQQVLQQPDAKEFVKLLSRNQWTCGLQQLNPQEKKQSPWGRPDRTLSMVDATQALPHNEQDQVTQGTIEHPWRKANLWNELL